MPYVTARDRKLALWREALRPDAATDADATARANLLDSWRDIDGPGGLAGACWRFLTARDLDGRPIIWTADERDDRVPVKPFPAEKEYLRDVLEELFGSERFVGVDKIRQKYISTLCMLACGWYAVVVDAREILVSKKTEDESGKLINDKIREPWGRAPVWVQKSLPISKAPYKVITALLTGSTISAVPMTFATGKGRGSTGSLVVVDEAAYQETFPKIYQAVTPMASRMWFVSTANVGNPGADLMKELVHEGRPSALLGEVVEGEMEEGGEYDVQGEQL